MTLLVSARSEADAVRLRDAQRRHFRDQVRQQK